MTNLTKLLLVCGLASVLFSCMSAKKAIYAVDLTAGTDTVNSAKYSTDQTIQVADLVQVQIQGLDPAIAMEFNMMVQNNAAVQNAGGRGQGQRVSEKGTVIVPRIGEVEVVGLTVEAAAAKISTAVSRFVKEPTVIVSVLNFRVSVLGAVRDPGEIVSKTDRMTILDALAQAGDIQLSGLRDRVWVIREVNGLRTYQQMNLNKGDLFKSDYYYLKNNDVIYVQPNAMTAFFGSNTALFSTIGALAGIIALIVSLAR
jgi:polysaccharide export outer membrane protein